MPPPAIAANAELALKRSATTSVTRPPMLNGPSCFHADAMPVAAAGIAAAWRCMRRTCSSVTSLAELFLRSESSSGVARPGTFSAVSSSGGMTSLPASESRARAASWIW